MWLRATKNARLSIWPTWLRISTLEREQFGTTAVGSGMAMPHARLQGLDKAHAFFVRLREPVEFDAPDGQGVDLMFMLLSPTHADTDHVKALAALSRLCRSRTCTQALREASDVGAVHGILQQAAKDE
jgi:PTS system nitrogen regulatory IIA component